MRSTFDLFVPKNSNLVGKTAKEVQRNCDVEIRGLIKFSCGKYFTIEGEDNNIKKFIQQYMILKNADD